MKLNAVNAVQAIVRMALPGLSESGMLFAMTFGAEGVRAKRYSERSRLLSVCCGFSRIEGAVCPLLAFSEPPRTHRQVVSWRVIPCSDGRWLEGIELVFSDLPEAVTEITGMDDVSLFFSAGPELLRMRKWEQRESLFLVSLWRTKPRPISGFLPDPSDASQCPFCWMTIGVACPCAPMK